MEIDKVNKFLTQAMDECWHEAVKIHNIIPKNIGYGFCKCGVSSNSFIFDANAEDLPQFKFYQNDFSTWEGFGKLLEGMRDNSECGIIVTQQLLDMVITKSMYDIPENFAVAVYTYLKGESDGIKSR